MLHNHSFTHRHTNPPVVHPILSLSQSGLAASSTLPPLLSLSLSLSLCLSLPLSAWISLSLSFSLSLCVFCAYQAEAHNAAFTRLSSSDICIDVAVPRPPSLWRTPPVRQCRDSHTSDGRAGQADRARGEITCLGNLEQGRIHRKKGRRSSRVFAELRSRPSLSLSHTHSLPSPLPSSLPVRLRCWCGEQQDTLGWAAWRHREGQGAQVTDIFSVFLCASAFVTPLECLCLLNELCSE